MNEPTFENWSALESKSLDARRVERERIAIRESRIEVTEYLDAADIVRYFPQLERSTTA
jgi:hypothetical protein